MNNTRPRIGAPIEYGAYGIKKRLSLMEKYIKLNGKVILDVGCGNGAYDIEMAKKAELVVCIDIEKKRLTRLQSEIKEHKFKNIQGLLMDAEDLSFPDNYFDVVTLIEVLEHIPNPIKVLKEANRVLGKNGLITIFVPNKLWIFETHGGHIKKYKINQRIPLLSWAPKFIHERIANARIYTKNQLISELVQAGFTDIKIDYMFPPLDKIDQKLAPFLRRVLYPFEKTPLKVWGVSIFAIARNSKL